jgi:hypothetical protein
MRYSTSGFFFHQTIPSRSLIYALKYFEISLQTCLDVNKYVWSPAMQDNAGPVLRIRIWDPVLFYPLDLGSGSGMNFSSSQISEFIDYDYD